MSSLPLTYTLKMAKVEVKRLDQFRAESPLFKYGPLPPNNILQFFGVTGADPGAKSPSVSDGFYLLLTPLSPGPHTIHFYGELDLRPIGGPRFIQDITYNLTIGP